MRAGRIGSSRALGSTCMGTPHTARDTLSTVCPKYPYTLSAGGVPKQTSLDKGHPVRSAKSF